MWMWKVHENGVILTIVVSLNEFIIAYSWFDVVDEKLIKFEIGSGWPELAKAFYSF
jgi:hypothetical protein